MEIAIVDRGRGPEIEGTRITVYDVYHYLDAGNWRTEEIAEILGLSLEQLKSALRYIEENKAKVQEVHKKIEDLIASGNAPEIEAKLVESRKKRDTLLKKIRNSKHQEKNGVGNFGRR